MTGWAALCSGGKDSILAILEAKEADLPIDRLVTVDAPHGSYLYHAPATAVTPTIAARWEIDCERLTLEAAGSDSAGARDVEAEPLIDWATTTDARGIVTGVIASTYQRDLLADLCADNDLDLYAPLWGWSGRDVLETLLDQGVAADIVAVAAAGLDRTWLGRRLDRAAVDALYQLADRHGLHPAGEGGEFETLVVDAPGFAGPIRYRATPVWEGSAGYLAINNIEVES